MRKSLRTLVSLAAAAGLAAAVGSPAALAATSTQPAGLAIARLSASQQQRFAQLSPGLQREFSRALADPRLVLGTLDQEQARREYPGLDVTFSDSRSATVSPTEGARGADAESATAATYEVHSTFKHTMTILFVSNTASLDYYYVTDAKKVLSDRSCDWTDTGVTDVHVQNVSIHNWVESGLGYCNAHVNITDPVVGLDNGYVDQKMRVNGSRVEWTYFAMD